MSAAPLRLFVAIYPPLEARRVMLDAFHATSAAAVTTFKTTPIEYIHLTLHFIGDTSKRELDEVRESVHRSVSGLAPFVLRPRRLITLPERGHPRLVAIETDSPPTLLEAHRRLASRLSRKSRIRPSDTFLPHLTLCRFAADSIAQRIDHSVTLPPFEVANVSLMRSILKPTGAEHVLVEAVQL